MHRSRSALVAIALLAGALVPGGADAARDAASSIPPDAEFVPRQVLVRFDDASTAAARAAALAEVGGTIIRTLPLTGFRLVTVDRSVRAAVDALARDEAIDWVEPNYTGTIALEANDPCLAGCGGGTQWNVEAVNAPAGWDVLPGTFYTSAQKKNLTRVSVAVLDTKIEVDQADWLNASPLPVNHPYDAANGGQLDMSKAVDIVPQHKWTGSADYHGTFVAGILGAAAHNGAGVAGLGYRATLIPITVVDGGGVATAADVATGVSAAQLAGARVINLSLGVHENSVALQSAIDKAVKAGALVVAAAGNDGSNKPFYPASLRNVVAVSGVDRADRRAPCSNFGGHISVAAPGMNILSLDPRAPSGYAVAGCGTSTAAPHVSALAALLFAQDPSRTPAQVRQIIERTADDDRFFPGRDDYFGEGRVNFERALRVGQGPEVDRVITTVPRALGGSSTFTATARAVSTTPITGAEFVLGSMDRPTGRGEVFAADGSFGDLDEELTVEVNIPLSFPTGVHRVFMRARDASGWGPASVGVLIVDRRAPTITRYEVAPAALGTAGQPLTISFDASDDQADTLEYTFRVISQLSGQVLFTSAPGSMSRSTETSWTPPAGALGPYTVELTVTDDAMNPARARATTVLL